MSTTTITTTALYDILSEKLGREQAKNLVDYVDAKIDKSVDDRIKDISTKTDIAELKAVFKDDIINLQRWMIGIFVTLALMIIGLYFRK
jgi:flagellar biosynthesis component FlhA